MRKKGIEKMIKGAMALSLAGAMAVSAGAMAASSGTKSLPALGVATASLGSVTYNNNSGVNVKLTHSTSAVSTNKPLYFGLKKQTNPASGRIADDKRYTGLNQSNNLYYTETSVPATHYVHGRTTSAWPKPVTVSASWYKIF